MGHGITEVTALAGYDVTMRDIEDHLFEDGYEDIQWSLENLAEKGRIDEDPARFSTASTPRPTSRPPSRTPTWS
jgi:3-hydroxyacyl-CoA dehydrogenase